MSDLPILYSFRRCPYAMRARMALWISGTNCVLREVKLADKPQALCEISPKATVPVLVIADGAAPETAGTAVVEESAEIMRWALARNDPENWLAGDDAQLIARNDGPFKDHLDRYKYPTRYEDCDPQAHRAKGLEILAELNANLARQAQLCAARRTFADIALFPFIRQFANTDRAWFDAQDLAHLQRWLAGHLASALFSAIMAKYAVWKPGDETIFTCPPAQS